VVNYIVKENNVIKNKEFEYEEGVTIGLTSEMFLTRDEIVYDIVTNRLSEEDKLYFKGINKSDLVMEHLGFGMWIRNTYGLWECLVNPLSEENPEADSIKHPDNCSFEIMTLVTETLNGDFTPNVSYALKNYEDAMKIVGDV